jgi:hypothetical protein
MARTSKSRRYLGLALLPAVVALSACKDDLAKPLDRLGDQDPAVLKDLPPGIYPVFSALGWTTEKRGGPFHTSVYLIPVKIAEEIGSYQGELQYDPNSVSINDVQVPPGLMAVWNEVAPGVIRFAGISVEGLAKSPILLFDVDSDGPIRATHFKVRVEEVVAAREFVNLTGEVATQEAPILLGDGIQGG